MEKENWLVLRNKGIPALKKFKVMKGNETWKQTSIEVLIKKVGSVHISLFLHFVVFCLGTYLKLVLENKNAISEPEMWEISERSEVKKFTEREDRGNTWGKMEEETPEVGATPGDSKQSKLSTEHSSWRWAGESHSELLSLLAAPISPAGAGLNQQMNQQMT